MTRGFIHLYDKIELIIKKVFVLSYLYRLLMDFLKRGVMMKELFKAITETIKEGVLMIDRDFNCMYANKAVNSIGIDNDTIIGKSIFDVFPNLKKETSTFCHVFETKTPLLDKQQTFITYRGERKTTLTSTYPILENGQVVGAFELFHDISVLQEISDQLMQMQLQSKIDRQTRRSQTTNQSESLAFIGESPMIVQVKSEMNRIAKSPSPVFIYGETGTGKEVFVHALHQAYDADVPLIAQNCAAIPENLMEAYFFGTTKGSYTGAVDQEGLFELADGGILFLDEINSLPINLQAKLLRVLQEKKFRRVGGTKEISVNVRVIVASNIPPNELVINNELRMDLYYRLSVFNIELPPLRERKDDIPRLVDYFIDHFNELLGKRISGITEEGLHRFKAYAWPGNIRELKNALERLMNQKDEGFINKSDIDLYNVLQDTHVIREQFAYPSFAHLEKNVSLKAVVQETEIHTIKKELYRTGGNISQAARNLDVPQQSLSNKVKKYKLGEYILKLKLPEKE